MKENIEKLINEIKTLQIQDGLSLEQFRLKYLSKNGLINELFLGFRDVPINEKKEIGQLLNSLKIIAGQLYNEKKAIIENQTDEKNQHIDLTLPITDNLGARHPISIIRNEIISIFSRIGFVLSEGPEIEDDWHNFTALNFPPEHPARDMQDTIFVGKDPDIALRTHTSSVQVRVMEKQKPPIRTLFPGRVYRNEAISARAHVFFHQVEGLYIDKKVSFTDLKKTLLYFSKEMFGEKTKIRLRPSYFPFTEPSAELDISCNLCGGTGCAFCKKTGWVEILGCGMVDPSVLQNCGIDSSVYSGFAFGMGVERITNLKFQVKDLRMFSENDLRFLKQFEKFI